METVGIPVAVAAAAGYMLFKQSKWIQNDLTKDLHHKFNRIEDIVDKDLRMILIKLIDNAKKNEIKLEGINRSNRALVEIIAKLSGNGLKHKFLSMMRDKEDDFK